MIKGAVSVSEIVDFPALVEFGNTTAKSVAHFNSKLTSPEVLTGAKGRSIIFNSYVSSNSVIRMLTSVSTPWIIDLDPAIFSNPALVDFCQSVATIYDAFDCCIVRLNFEFSAMKHPNLSATKLTLHMGIPTTRVAAILNENSTITADTALRLAHVFKMSPEFWLNLQSNYEVAMLDYTGEKERICKESRELATA